MTVLARAPGRVNLIGEHTDYTGGLVLPMAIDRATTVEGERRGQVVRLRSLDEPVEVVIALDVDDPSIVEPPWGRYVAGVVKEMGTSQAPRGTGFVGTVTTTVPIGAGLSSSAALEVAVALALGFEGTALELAQLCQRAEQRASGVPCGIMDQLSSAAGVAGHLTLIDCHSLTVEPVALPTDVEVVVVHGHHRTLVGSPYADRVADCAMAEAQIGPLRLATVADTGTISDPTVRARARHVVSENERVRRFVDAIRADDLETSGQLMAASHRSMRDDYEITTAIIDDLVERLARLPGVFGVRMTGGGFGGCVVALSRPGAISEGWVMRPSAGARVVTNS